MGFQSSINSAIGTVAAAKIAADYKKEKEEKAKVAADEKAAADAEALQKETTSTMNSLHIANERMAKDQAAIDEHSKYESFSNKKGREQFRDKSTGKLIKRFDYEQHQKALKTAQEQLTLSTAIRDSFKERLAKLTGGNN